MDVSGRRVLVTGASRGIGEAIARAFAGAGARVALVARSEGPLKELAAELGGTAFPTDLGDPQALRGLIDRVEADGGPVDVLVNNAGVDAVGAFTATTEADIDQLYRVNLLAPVLLCRQVIPGMLERGSGHVVNVSSLAGTAVFPGLVAYSSSKAGLTHFTAGLRADLRGRPIGTTVVEMGLVPTDMGDNVENYPPTAKSFARFHHMHVLASVSPATVAAAVVEAVRHDRRHVRFPKRALAFPLLAEAPRRIVEVFLTGVPHQN